MSDALSTADSNLNPFAMAADIMPVVKNDMKTWDSTVPSGTWRPSLRLINGKAKMAQPPANLKAGHFYFCRTSNGIGAQDLGEVVLVVPVASRHKAVKRGFDPKEGEKWVSYFDETSKDFREVMEMASQPGNTGAFYGPEYLVWVDGATDAGGAWANFHCSSATARGAAVDIESQVGRGKIMRFKAYLAQNKKGSWEAFMPEIANAALQLFPSTEEIVAECKKFNEERKLGKVVEDTGDRPQ